MKLFKQIRRERALARFSIMTWEQWLRSTYGDETILVNEKPQPEDHQAYDDYMKAKQVELASLNKGG